MDPISPRKTQVTISKTGWLQERASHVSLAPRERWPTMKAGGVSAAARAYPRTVLLVRPVQKGISGGREDQMDPL